MMPTGQASVDVIISYSRTDSDFVDRLEADLKAHNLTVWVDRRKLEGGQVWDTEIRNAIDQCRILLMVISPAALDSPWVTKEYQYALKRHKEVIPVRYLPSGELPSELQRLQWVDFQLTMNFESTYPAHLQELLKAINFHIERYNATEAARQSRQAKREKSRRVRLVGSLALYSILIVLLSGVIGHTFFPKQVVKTVPVLQYVPVLAVPATAISLAADSVNAHYGSAVTLTATTDTPVGGTGHIIDIWDTFDNVQVGGGQCSTGSTCQVTIPGPSFTVSITFQAFIDKGGDLSTKVASSGVVTVTWSPPT